MGLVKAKLMQWEALGITSGRSGSVCANCICDPVLAEFIEENASETSCKYCSRSSSKPFACGLDEVVEFMAEAIKDEWTDPANELPYDGREGGYQGETLDGWDLLGEVGFEPDNQELFEDVAS